MDILDCYQLLELQPEASIDQIKASYRRLARRYHPDANPNDQAAKNKFIALTEAYNKILASVQHSQTPKVTSQPQSTEPQSQAAPQGEVVIKVKRQEKSIPTPPLSANEQLLKRNSYLEWQQFLKYKRFSKAIALIENLAQRFPQDPEVRQWQALTYQRWARQLLNENKLDKARIYLKKALKTDPHNRSLWSEVERDFRRMEKIF